MEYIKINSAQAVKDKLRTIAKEKDVEFSLVMRDYIYDRFIERLSKSKYKDKFILKGGFFISKVFGIDSRNTVDIDTAVQKTKLTEENIVKMINEIISIDVNDNVVFEIEKVEPIREEDEYGGIRVTIKYSLEEMKQKFHIDIATGDPIYPGPEEFSYEPLIKDDTYKVLSYTLETVLAEKIETILSRLEKSSRPKDFYDIYLIHEHEYHKINKTRLRKAVEQTFKKREFNSDLLECLNIVRKSKILETRWNSYSKKNKYAKGIEYSKTIECLEDFVKILI